jgi:RHS repeat-associated protein
MIQPGRKYSATGAYRYGFQGQEKDDETKGEGNTINFTFRIYDPRIGRFFSIDPLTSKYPFYSPYHFSSNQPIHAPELEGLESKADLTLPKDPWDVDLTHWTVDNTYKHPHGLQWTDADGNKLIFNIAQSGKKGWEAIDHWHFEDKRSRRYNALGQIAKSKGADEAHLTPGTKTSIKINVQLPIIMAAIDAIRTFTGILSGDPDAIINWFGPAKPGELKIGVLHDLGAYDAQIKMYGQYHSIINEEIKETTENGVKVKTITRTIQHYEKKRFDDKLKKYVGDTPIGPKFQQTETYKDGKLIDKGQQRAGGNIELPPA